MKPGISSITVLIISAAAQTLFSGCSLIGLAVDRSSAPDTLAASVADKELEGKNILITMRDGYSFAGECRKLGSLPAELYRSRYLEWQRTLGSEAVPFAPGDSVIVGSESGETARGYLEGFESNSVVLLLFPKARPLSLQKPQRASIPAKDLDFLRRFGGPLVNGAVLRSLLAREGVPAIGGMLVRSGEKTGWVPADDVAGVRVVRYSYDWMSRGAIADAVGLAAAVVFFSVRK